MINTNKIDRDHTYLFGIHKKVYKIRADKVSFISTVLFLLFFYNWAT